MKITCHSCSAKYTVSDEKVQGKTVKIKCRKCGATILVGAGAHSGDAGGGSEPVDAASVNGTGDGTFLVNVNDGDQRNMTLPEIIDAYNSEVINAETYVWQDGMEDWQTLGENDAIVAALHAAPDAAAASAAAPAAAMGQAPLSQPPMDQAPMSQPPMDQPPMGQAPLSQPPMSQPPMAAGPASQPPVGMSPFDVGGSGVARAAVRREPSKVDLFGGGTGSSPGFGGGDVQGATESSPGGSTGKRDENSVLFSLNALTASTGAPASQPGAMAGAAVNREDSGLIDLKALASSAAATGGGGAPAVDAMAPGPLGVPDMGGGLGVFPLGMPAPPPAAATAPALDVPVQPQPKGKLPVIIGALVAVLAMVAVFVVVSSGGEETTPAASATPPTPTPLDTPTPIATETAEPVASAETAPSASASAGAVAQVPGGWKPPPGGAKPPPGGAKPPPGGATPPPPPPPPAGKSDPCKAKCGSDLMCMMACSSK